MDIKLAPSILAADFTRLGEQIRAVEAAGVEMIHVDVMDGQFVPNLTMGTPLIEAARRSTALLLDIHLMIIEPDHLIPLFAKAATPGLARMSVHWEACPNLHRTLSLIRNHGCGVGVAINPHTPASFLSEILPMLDVVLVMTVNPGFGGQTFLESTLPKIAQLRQMINALGHPIDIEVDGGINETTISKVVSVGANSLVVGSAVFSEKFSVNEGIASVRAAYEQVNAPVAPHGDQRN